MAEQQTSQERTEQPTQKRKDEARKKGQVPRSRELNTMLLLVIGSLGLVVFGGGIVADLRSLFEAALSFDRDIAFDAQLIPALLLNLMLSSVIALMPFFLVMIAGAFVGPVLMGGLSFNTSSMGFKLEKMNPLKWFQRVFSAKGMLELLKTLLKFVLLSGSTAFLFYLLLDELLFLGSHPYIKAFSESVTLLVWGLVAISATMIFIVVFDVPFELWNHNKQLKMTLQEVKDELKESDGRPEVKSRVRALQREISQRRMMEAVPTADVVITNPTHFAVALKYEGSAGSAPVVLAKGQDLMALRIRSVAEENGVAICSAPPLARALYASADIGEEIPHNLYLAVAKVLAYVYQLRTSGGDASFSALDDIALPDEYQNLNEEGGADGN